MKPITKERGEKPETIAIWFDVAVGSVYNIFALHTKTGNVLKCSRFWLI